MSIRARLVLAAFGVLLVSNTAWAQPGTFRWQQQPYCNVLTLYVVQEGGGNYTLDGTDDMCGAPQRASVRGLAHVNPDGTIGFGLVITSGGRSTTLNATITLASLGGAWTDSHGNTGTFVFTPGAGAPGSPRPAASSTVVKVTHSYDLAAGATSAPFTLPANVPIEIKGVQLVPGFRGIGHASLLSIAGSGGFIEWVGQHSESGLTARGATTVGFNGTAGTPILYIDWSHCVSVQVAGTAGSNQIQIHNACAGARNGNLTIIY